MRSARDRPSQLRLPDFLHSPYDACVTLSRKIVLVVDGDYEGGAVASDKDRRHLLTSRLGSLDVRHRSHRKPAEDCDMPHEKTDGMIRHTRLDNESREYLERRD